MDLSFLSSYCVCALNECFNKKKCTCAHDTDFFCNFFVLLDNSKNTKRYPGPGEAGQPQLVLDMAYGNLGKLPYLCQNICRWVRGEIIFGETGEGFKSQSRRLKRPLHN